MCVLETPKPSRKRRVRDFKYDGDLPQSRKKKKKPTENILSQLDEAASEKLAEEVARPTKHVKDLNAPDQAYASMLDSITKFRIGMYNLDPTALKSPPEHLGARGIYDEHVQKVIAHFKVAGEN